MISGVWINLVFSEDCILICIVCSFSCIGLLSVLDQMKKREIHALATLPQQSYTDNDDKNLNSLVNMVSTDTALELVAEAYLGGRKGFHFFWTSGFSFISAASGWYLYGQFFLF